MTSIAVQPGFAAAPSTGVAPRRAAPEERGFDDALASPAPRRDDNDGDRKVDRDTMAADNDDGPSKAAGKGAASAGPATTQPAAGKHGDRKEDDTDAGGGGDDDGDDLPPRLRTERALAMAQALQAIPLSPTPQPAADPAKADGGRAGAAPPTPTDGGTGTAAGAIAVPPPAVGSLAPLSSAKGTPASTALVQALQPPLVASPVTGDGPVGAGGNATAVRATTSDPSTAEPRPAADAGKEALKGVEVDRSTAVAGNTAPSRPTPTTAKVDVTILANVAVTAAVAGGGTKAASGTGASGQASAPPSPGAAASMPAVVGHVGAARLVASSADDGGSDVGGGQDGSGAGNADPQTTPKVGPQGSASAAPATASVQMVPAATAPRAFAAAIAAGMAAGHADARGDAGAERSASPPSPVQTLRIQLRPVDLGAVIANLRYAGGQLSIDVQVETQEAHHRLSADSDDIVKSLQSLGLQVDKISVRQLQAPAQATGRDATAGNPGSGQTAFSMSGQSGQSAGGQAHHGHTENRYESAGERKAASARPAGDGSARRGVFI